MSSSIDMTLVSRPLVAGRGLRAVSPGLQFRHQFSPSCKDQDKSTLIRHFTRQRDLFRISLNKIEGLSRLDCLQRPGFRMLEELARETRKLARDIWRDLERGTNPADPWIPSPARIEQSIERTSDLQDLLQRQLALVVQWQEDADELRAELDLLVGSKGAAVTSLSFDGLRALARRLIAELLYDVTPPSLHPRLAIEMLSERLENRDQARIFAVALGSAQVAARVARVTWLHAEHVELVTAAALLQDCGKLLVVQPGGANALQTHRISRPRHSQVGASIVTRFRNAPPELAPLIAAHHSRLKDLSAIRYRGTGEFQNFARLVAVSGRFERLRVGLANDTSLLSSPEAVDQPAMSRLWQEALEGHWDQTLVRKILVQRDGHLECMATTSSPSRNRETVAQYVHS